MSCRRAADRGLELRARSALTLAEHGKNTDCMLQSAEQDARRLKRDGQPRSVAHAHYVRAAIAACREAVPAHRGGTGFQARLACLAGEPLTVGSSSAPALP